MATIINTSDDLLKLLAENAEFYQAVRRLILTDELIELPERFARFTAEVHDFITRQEQFNAEQRQFNEEQRQFNHRIETAIGELKGNTARYVVGVLFGEIAEHLGFTFKDTLSRQQLRQMIGPQGHTDVSSGDRDSFIRADLVVIADDAAGDIHYIAVEASYTGDARDTARARRNAQLLQRFTGCPTHAVIASVHNDRDIQAEIDSGEVHWYALNPDDFTPE
jgi:FtsZ-binding cell division protein ZapB